MDKKKMEKKKHHLYEFSSGPHRERALLPCRKMYYMTVATEATQSQKYLRVWAHHT